MMAATKYVVIRDDDACAFTRVSWLEQLYRPLLDRGLPFCLSVIPKIRTDVPIRQLDNNGYWKRERLEYEPFIPPSQRGRSSLVPVSENEELIRFVAEHRQIEIAQHGYSHEMIDDEREFCDQDVRSLSHKIDGGFEILTTAFGMKPQFFVPPWDGVSRQALELLSWKFSGISCAAYPHDILPAHLLPKFAIKKLRHQRFLFLRDFLIVEHPATYLSLFNDPDWIVEQIIHALSLNPFLILVNHYWEYFFDWRDSPQIDYFDAWMKVLQHLISRDDVEIIGFQQLYHLLRTRQI